MEKWCIDRPQGCEEPAALRLWRLYLPGRQISILVPVKTRQLRLEFCDSTYRGYRGDTLLHIVTYPHPTLRHKSKPIKRVDAELRDAVRQMFDLMYAARGVGLAANQIDLPLRVFVVNLEARPDRGEELVFLNPVISLPKGSEVSEEGCLSLPDLYGPVVRPKQVTVSAYNLAGELVEARIEGMFARVVQHELDHLDGVLFTDRMTQTALANAQLALNDFESRFRMRREAGEIASDEQIAAKLLEWERRYC